MINVVSVQSGWILQKIAERIVDADETGKLVLAKKPTNDAIANFYVDSTNLFSEKTNTFDIGLFTHADRNQLDQVPPTIFRLNFIIHMCKKYYDMFKEVYPPENMKVIYPIEIPIGYELRKPKLGIIQRGMVEGKGFYFMKSVSDLNVAKNFSFVFVGSGWDEVVSLFQDKKIEVTYYSNDEDYQHYKNIYMDYLLIPSLWEGGPMSLIEAFAVGIPVIAPDVGFVKDFGVDYLYETGDLMSLENILNSIFSTIKNRRDKIEKYSYSKFANELIEIIEKRTK